MKSYERSAPPWDMEAMSSTVRFNSWKLKPPALRIAPPSNWLPVIDSGWLSDQAVPSSLRSTPRKPLASRRRIFAPMTSIACNASPMIICCAAKVGSNQFNDGCPSLK
ncbi:hypothetical protein D3C84_778890 [compost metagenome]